MKKSAGLVHAIFHCEDCEWEAPNYKNAQAIAAKHAMTKKHKVTGETGIAIIYDGR